MNLIYLSEGKPITKYRDLQNLIIDTAFEQKKDESVITWDVYNFYQNNREYFEQRVFSKSMILMEIKNYLNTNTSYTRNNQDYPDYDYIGKLEAKQRLLMYLTFTCIGILIIIGAILYFSTIM